MELAPEVPHVELTPEPEVPHVDLAPEVPHAELTPEPEVQHVELTPEVQHVELTPEVPHVQLTPEVSHVELTPEAPHVELKPEVEPVDILTEITDAEEVEVDLGPSCPAQVQGITLQSYCTENWKKNIPRKETARPQSQFVQSCICERFYIFPRSVCLVGCSKIGGPIPVIYKSTTDL